MKKKQTTSNFFIVECFVRCFVRFLISIFMCEVFCWVIRGICGTSYRADGDVSSSNESKSSTFVGEEEVAFVVVAISSVSGANVGSLILTFPLSLLLLSTSFLSSSKSSKSSSLLLEELVGVPPPPSPPLLSRIGPNVLTKNCIIIWSFCSIIYGTWVSV